jgi:hypothetical protein
MRISTAQVLDEVMPFSQREGEIQFAADQYIH